MEYNRQQTTMKQHLLTLFLALAASVAPLFAQSGTCGDNLTWTLDTESGILTISGTGAMANYTYSSKAPWYSYRESIKTVTIDNSVTSIGEYAFYECSKLTSITIPNSVTSIGDYAFGFCSSLTSVTIPNSVTSIGNNAFYNCRSLTSVTIPNSVISIGSYAFSNCSSLTSVTIPNSVTSIGDYAFNNCSSLTSITVDYGNPNYCDIDGVLFNKNKTTLIRYPEGKSATSYIIPNSVTSIGIYAFYKCSSLTSVTIPNSVTSIGSHAFNDCSNLTYITIPNSVTSIGNNAFNGCTGLTSITIPNSVTSIGNYAFSECSKLTSVTIPNSVTSIGIYAFYNCTGLTSVTIPNGVTSIGQFAFQNCTGLTAVHISDIAAWCKIAFGTSDANPLSYAHNLYLNGTLVTDLVIPNSVTSIGNNAFYNCRSLTSITIPNSVTSIGDGAFWYCSSLTSVTIPNSATSIGKYAFSNCSSLTSITCEAVVSPTLEYNVFYNVDKSIPLYVPAQSIDLYKAADQWKDFTNILPIIIVGTFSVSATQQVTFSPGNLQYQASTNTWRFAEHQWDMVGMGYGQTNTDNDCYIGGTVSNSDNRQIGSNYSGWIDLFGWGTGNAPTKSSEDYSDYQTFVDWGTNAISNGGNQANMWRTLTNDEWNYLFSGRANASSKYGVGMVNGINGMIVLPDEFTLPSGLTFTSGVHDSYGWQYYKEVNEYSAAEWARMEACGALFLPAAGGRGGSGVDYVGGYGYYWSSTPYYSRDAYSRSFCSSSTGLFCNDRSGGHSVRLARAAQSEQEPVYSLSVSIEGEGTVTGAGEYKSGTPATLTATPASGYTFTQWSDGNTDNPRDVIVTGDATFTAVFEKNELPSDITLQENESSDYYTQFAQDYNGVTVTTATLNRQFTQGKWATLCLPFNVNKALMTSLGLYNRVFELRYAEQLDDETIQMYFAPAQTLEAGKGYIVNPNAKLAEKTSFVFPNVTINTDSDNGDITALTGYNDGTGRGNLYLVGTLRTGILQGTTTGNTYLGLKDNQLYYPNSTSGTPVRAYRAVFRSDIHVNASRLRIIADGVDNVELIIDNGRLSVEADAVKYIENGILYIRRNGTTYNAQGQVIIVN